MTTSPDILPTPHRPSEKYTGYINSKNSHFKTLVLTSPPTTTNHQTLSSSSSKCTTQLNSTHALRVAVDVEVDATLPLQHRIEAVSVPDADTLYMLHVADLELELELELDLDVRVGVGEDADVLEVTALDADPRIDADVSGVAVAEVPGAGVEEGRGLFAFPFMFATPDADPTARVLVLVLVRSPEPNTAVDDDDDAVGMACAAKKPLGALDGVVVVQGVDGRCFAAGVEEVSFVVLGGLALLGVVVHGLALLGVVVHGLVLLDGGLVGLGFGAGLVLEEGLMLLGFGDVGLLGVLGVLAGIIGGRGFVGVDILLEDVLEGFLDVVCMVELGFFVDEGFGGGDGRNAELVLFMDELGLVVDEGLGVELVLLVIVIVELDCLVELLDFLVDVGLGGLFVFGVGDVLIMLELALWVCFGVILGVDEEHLVELDFKIKLDLRVELDLTVDVCRVIELKVFVKRGVGQGKMIGPCLVDERWLEKLPGVLATVGEEVSTMGALMDSEAREMVENAEDGLLPCSEETDGDVLLRVLDGEASGVMVSEADTVRSRIVLVAFSTGVSVEITKISVSVMGMLLVSFGVMLVDELMRELDDDALHLPLTSISAFLGTVP
tara:strand:+ start:32749 stop:34575 length:1827 start_codon:yes stop_codon:yes gene_type:complete